MALDQNLVKDIGILGAHMVRNATIAARDEVRRRRTLVSPGDMDNQEERRQDKRKAVINDKLIDTLRASTFNVRLVNIRRDLLNPAMEDLRGLSIEERTLQVQLATDQLAMMRKINMTLIDSSFIMSTWFGRQSIMIERFKRHPGLMSMVVVSNLLSKTFNMTFGLAKSILLGRGDQRSDTQKIVDSVDRVYEFMRTGQVNRRTSFFQDLMSGGLLGLAGRGFGQQIGVTRELAQKREDARARGEAVSAGFIGAMADKFFGNNIIQRKLTQTTGRNNIVIISFTPKVEKTFEKLDEFIDLMKLSVIPSQRATFDDINRSTMNMSAVSSKQLVYATQNQSVAIANAPREAKLRTNIERLVEIQDAAFSEIEANTDIAKINMRANRRSAIGRLIAGILSGVSMAANSASDIIGTAVAGIGGLLGLKYLKGGKLPGGGLGKIFSGGLGKGKGLASAGLQKAGSFLSGGWSTAKNLASAAGGTRVGSFLKGAGARAFGLLTPVLAGFNKSQELAGQDIGTLNKRAQVVSTALGAAGGSAMGTAIGSAIGTFVAPGVGTVVGGLIGGGIGAWLGGEGGSEIGGYVGPALQKAFGDSQENERIYGPSMIESIRDEVIGFTSEQTKMLSDTLNEFYASGKESSQEIVNSLETLPERLAKALATATAKVQSGNVDIPISFPSRSQIEEFVSRGVDHAK